jgi:hypothetical protein
MIDINTMLCYPEAFYAWLESQPEWTEIGTRGECDACPIARYLAACGVVEPMVYPNHIFSGACPMDYVDTPHWVCGYIDVIDREDGPITREEALWAFENMPR